MAALEDRRGVHLMVPMVTLVVAARNEEANIVACLRSLEAQDYDPSRLEVIVVDGESTDRTREHAAAIVDAHPGWRLLDNPRRIQAAAWNLGIREATGDVVGIVSGHAELAPDYVSQSVETLQRTGAAMVGGPVTALTDGPVSSAIGAAMASPFGVGGARHHYLTEEAETDTVFMGLATSATYRAFPFDEAMVRNQDDELSYRLIDAGHRIVCNPAIRSRYRVRSSIGALARQYWAYGYWKVAVLARHPRRAKARHVVPALVVGGLAVIGPLSLVSGSARALLLAGSMPYLAIDAVLAARQAREEGAASGLALFSAFPAMHFSYGAGFVRGLVDAWRKRS
jgi:glycosyltransferase involved in cell wall biosynthesis